MGRRNEKCRRWFGGADDEAGGGGGGGGGGGWGGGAVVFHGPSGNEGVVGDERREERSAGRKEVKRPLR